MQLTDREKYLKIGVIETFNLNDATKDEIINVCEDIIKVKGRHC